MCAFADASVAVGRHRVYFVNDSSTDASEAVLQAVVSSYPQRRDQVTVLRNDINRGSAYSRQRGVDAASGEFVIHCDADDWVDAEMYGTMLRVADSTGADVVCTPYYLEKGKGRCDTVGFPSLDYPQLNDMPLDTLHCSLCNKIIRRSVIIDNGIRFLRGSTVGKIWDCGSEWLLQRAA